MTKLQNLGWRQCHCTTLLLSLRGFFLLSLRAEGVAISEGESVATRYNSDEAVRQAVNDIIGKKA